MMAYNYTRFSGIIYWDTGFNNRFRPQTWSLRRFDEVTKLRLVALEQAVYSPQLARR